MAFDLSSITKGAEVRSPLIVIHGAPGAGKTTFAAGAEDPIFIRVEDGLGILEVDTFPLADNLSDVMEAITSLYGEHNYKTVVIDSLSALEPLIWNEVCKQHGVGNIEEIGYHKGYIFAMDYWRDFVSACLGLCKKGMPMVLIAHSEIVAYNAPDSDTYDRYQIKLHKRAFAYLYEQADIIGFAQSPVFVKKDDKKDKSGRAVSKRVRELVVSDSPSAIAKNRYNMPTSIKLEWGELSKYIPAVNNI